MFSMSKFILVCSLICMIKPVFSTQSYDKTACNTQSQLPGSNYLCVSKDFSCQTYIVYRAQKHYQTLSSISYLFNLDVLQLSINNISQADSVNLKPGREVLIPVNCACPDRFSRAIFSYNMSHSESYDDVACGVFEGLVKSQVLVEENPHVESNHRENVMIQVPIRCACVDDEEIRNEFNHLVTYPIMEKDHTSLMAKKFSVPQEMIWNVNQIGSFDSIFPQTTLLIPTKDVPLVNWEVYSPPHNPGATIPLNKLTPSKQIPVKNYVLLGAIILAVIILIVVALMLSISIWKLDHAHKRFRPLSGRGCSHMSNYSANFLDGMSKLKNSLPSFSLEELSIATEDFGLSSVIGKAVYRGKFGMLFVAIEEMSTEEASQHVINILTRINHINIVKLEGCCYGTSPYLVFEFAQNGSLRDCLSKEKMAKQLTWKIRMQIAFDLAVGIHYIHFCTKPSYVHRNINSRNVLITTDWRAKLSGFRLAKPLICIGEEEEINWTESQIVGREGYLATEYLHFGLASAKMDIYAFGVVLLELLTAREAIKDGDLLKDSVKILGDGVISSSCLEKMKGFMDPALEGVYEMGDAVCLTLLAKACVEDDPHHRPTMNDVLKTLSRIL